MKMVFPNLYYFTFLICCCKNIRKTRKPLPRFEKRKYKECENKGQFSPFVTIVMNLCDLLFVVRQDNRIFA